MNGDRKILGPIHNTFFEVYRRFPIFRTTYDCIRVGKINDHFIVRDYIGNRDAFDRSRYWRIYVDGRYKGMHANITLDEAIAKWDRMLINEGFTLLTEEQAKKIEILL